MEVAYLSDELPYRDIVDGWLVDRYGRVSGFFEMEAPAADVASNDMLAQIQDTLSALVEAMPPRVVQTQFVYTTNGDYRDMIASHMALSSGNSLVTALRNARGRSLLADLQARKLMKTTVIMVVTAQADAITEEAPSVWSRLKAEKQSLSMKERVLRRMEFDEAWRTVSNHEGVMADSLGRAGITIRRLRSTEVANFFYRLMNPDLAVDSGIPLNYDPDSDGFYDGWLCSDVFRREDCLLWGKYYHGLVTAYGKPQYTQPRMIETLTEQLPFTDFRVTLTVRRTDRDAIINRLDLKRKQAFGSMRMGINPVMDKLVGSKQETANSGGEHMTEVRDEISESSELMSALKKNECYIAQTELSIHLWHTDRAELERRQTLVRARINEFNRARGWCETHTLGQVFRGTLPGACLPMYRDQHVRDRMMADLVPLHKGFSGGTAAACVFRNAHKGLVGIDLFDRAQTDAGMGFVSGAKGSGKSVLSNLLVLQHFYQTALRSERPAADPLVMILDIGGSYNTLVSMLGGTVINFSQEAPTCLNPLQLGSHRGATVKIPSKAEMVRMVTNIATLVTRPGEVSPPDKLVQLAQVALEAVFSKMSGVAPYVTIEDLCMQLGMYAATDSGAAELANRLSRFRAGGVYEKFTNGSTAVDADTRVIAFDLGGLDRMPDLQQAMVPLIINFIHDMVHRHPGERKIVLMDEMWRFISNDHLSGFIVEAYKTFRKENAAVIGVSQALADATMNPSVSNALVQNVDYWFLLEQGQQDYVNYARDLLKLTDGQVSIIKSLKRANTITARGEVERYREALMIRGQASKGDSGRVRVWMPPEEYWMFTTEPEERARRAEAVDAFHGNVEQAIEFLARKYPGGLHARKIDG